MSIKVRPSSKISLSIPLDACQADIANKISQKNMPTMRQLSSIFPANLRVEAACANGGMTFTRAEGLSITRRNGIPSKEFWFASRSMQIAAGSDGIKRYWLPLSWFLFNLSGIARASVMSAFMLENVMYHIVSWQTRQYSRVINRWLRHYTSYVSMSNTFTILHRAWG